ncbi:MAG TPA: glycerol-3-phosphate 1-O-acyltransferase PlsY [Terriglobales bacterium]|nr:glycerol-3-phosphate 1-O-acyltransferase PlsY [Terriglobales bacterium]
MPFYIATAVIAYLLGSIPFGYILVRVFRGQDVRDTGSGNIGATNVARASPGLGALTLFLDATKGLLAVTAGSLLAVSASRGTAKPLYAFAAIAAALAVVGHMFPIWLKFHGGKGVATSVGVLLALAPKTLLVAMALFVALVAAFRYVSLGSIIAAAAFPLIAHALHDYHSSPDILVTMCVIAALIIVKHRENIRRLLAGTESRFVLKKTRA